MNSIQKYNQKESQSDIIDVEFTEQKTYKMAPATKLFWAVTALLSLTAVKIPQLSIIHDLGSFIFVVWLGVFTLASCEWCKD